MIKFKNYEELIKMVNDSEYGLGGGVFTQDITKALIQQEQWKLGVFG